jgi:UPF0176 protein
MKQITISSFYSFAPLAEPKQLQAPLLARMRELGVRGTVTLAHEGVNATVSGFAESIDELLRYLTTSMPFNPPAKRETYFRAQPFKRTKVKVKPELISLGVPSYPAVCIGEYVQAEDWNALIQSPDVVIIDTRNDYEFAIGHFTGALNPATHNFKEMVAWTEQTLIPLRAQKNLAPGSAGRIAMYCTGGIRCEKYSSYLVAQGFGQVYHLHGGILEYLEKIPQSQSLWNGECFVFDERVSVGHRIVA